MVWNRGAAALLVGLTALLGGCVTGGDPLESADDEDAQAGAPERGRTHVTLLEEPFALDPITTSQGWDLTIPENATEVVLSVTFAGAGSGVTFQVGDCRAAGGGAVYAATAMEGRRSCDAEPGEARATVSHLTGSISGTVAVEATVLY